MEKQNPISQELQDLGSTLANIPAVNPYHVPAGYFDKFPVEMFNIASGPAIPVTLTGLSTPYAVPAGYFDNLPAAILKQVRSGSAPTVDIESAGEEIAAISPLLSGISKKTPFTVPDNYFSQLSEKVVSGSVVDAELQTLSPTLESLKTVNVYQVPTGYFGQFPEHMIQMVGSSAPARVVKGNFGRRFIQYAAAAVFTGLMITTGFFVLNRNQEPQQIVSTSGLREKASEASDEEILRYLEIQPAPLPDSLLTSDREIKADAILEMLADVSDEELQQYIQLQSDTKLLIN